MKITQENKNYLIYIAKYLGVALISGSVVHIGTLEGGELRYFVLMLIGLFLMTLGNISEAKQLGDKINTKFLLVITGLSLATGFLSGGVQHYLDNPVYAGWLLAIGVVVTYITFFMKEKFVLKNKNVLVATLLGIIILFFSNFVINKYIEIGHSGIESHHTDTMKMDMSMDSMMMDMLANMKGKTGTELEKVFLQDMIVHHQGAVDMATELLKDKTVRPELAKFAQDIINAQSKEIEMQKSWLEKWYAK